MHKYSGKNRRAVLRAMAIGLFLSQSAIILGEALAARGIGSPSFNGLGLMLVFVTGFVGMQLNRQRKIIANELRARQKLAETIGRRQAEMFAETPVPDNNTVSNALQSVVTSSGNDQEAVRTVLLFASRLKPIAVAGIFFSRHRKSGGLFSGLTNLGNFQASDSETVTRQMASIAKERVGQFKIWRDETTVFFHHFWKADPETVVNILDVFTSHILVFDVATMEYLGFGSTVLEPDHSYKGRGKRYVLRAEIEHGKLKGQSDVYGVVHIL